MDESPQELTSADLVVDGGSDAADRTRRREVAAATPTWLRVALGTLGGRTDDRVRWRRAPGKDDVTRVLRSLPPTWVVVSDLALCDAGIDNLVVGPTGVYTVHAVALSGRVTVHEQSVLHDGRATPYLSRARAEAACARRVLSEAVGWAVPVQPVIGVVGAEVVVEQRPEDVVVLPRIALRRWLVRRSGDVQLRRGHVIQLAQVAGCPETWRAA